MAHQAFTQTADEGNRAETNRDKKHLSTTRFAGVHRGHRVSNQRQNIPRHPCGRSKINPRPEPRPEPSIAFIISSTVGRSGRRSVVKNPTADGSNDINPAAAVSKTAVLGKKNPF
jgi:hypothetical protein